MTGNEMRALVESYFAAVDGEEFDAVSATMHADCRFSIATHGVNLEGIEQIGQMLQRLWRNHKAVAHLEFNHVADPDNGMIATRFQVRNTHHDGAIAHKSNCNFFKIIDGKFAEISVYMAGDNTLDID